MALPQNKLIPAMAIIGLAGLITLVVSLEPGGWGQKIRSATMGSDETRAADQDKGSESVESLASDVSSLEQQLVNAQQELQSFRSLEQQRQVQSDQVFEQKISSSINAIKTEYDKTVNDLMDSVRELSGQLQKQPTVSEMPVGMGMDTGTLENGFRVYRPLGKQRNGNLLTEAVDSTRNVVDGLLAGNPLNPFGGFEDGVNRVADASDLPVYTIAKNSTLMDATAITALIGRVPVNQVVFQPIPFKVVIGRENLAANDMWLPDVERMIFEGNAVGESTLKCVRGTLRSATFVFRDGTIRTVPHSSDSTRDGIGWISNDQGYPCIPGQFVTDAPKTLAELTLAGTAAGYADAIADNESAVVIDGGAISRVVTGDTTKFALGQGAKTGFDELARELARRARDRYDAVILQPGAKVAVHITRQLEIDF